MSAPGSPVEETETSDDSTHESPEVSIGRFLEVHRRERGISLDELESATRIPRRSLERLEAGHFDRDSDGFSRGFVRAVAVALGLDPDQTVAQMLAEPELPEVRSSSFSLALRPLLFLAAGLSLAIALGLVLQALVSGGDEAAELVHHRDPVRALAADEAGTASGPP